MRILAPNATALTRETQGAKRASSGSFQLDAADAAKPHTPVPTLRTVGGIDALVALQGFDDPAERRRRAVGKGRAALDVLDEIKLGLLAGALDPSKLNRLRVAAEQLKDRSGEPGLDSVLAEIELRVAVELAKMTPREGQI
ncbi:MAG: flagellar assembly protein FliX [Pseudorhodoplanes sp.]|nr:flagellar assembly protein FliX [Pseudorhodoplanes sp.]